jgi:hypothetical protein
MYLLSYPVRFEALLLLLLLLLVGFISVLLLEVIFLLAI